MAINRVELRQMIGSTPDLSNDPLISSDYSIVLSSYSFSVGMENTGTFYYYTVSYDVAGNVSSFSSVVTVKVDKK